MRGLTRFTPHLIFVLFIILGLLFKILLVEPERKNAEKQVITSDGIWYYSYLPATVIYHDLSFGFLPEVYKKNYSNDGFIPYPYYHKGKPLNKFFCGVAILQTPFFLAAHSLSDMLGYPSDGFSFIYQLFIWLAAVFYCAAGCAFLLRIFTSYGISERISVFSVLLVCFGTNLFYYAFHEPSMSHAYSFFAVSAFFYFARTFFLHQSKRSFIFICLALALIVLIRPVDVLIVLLLPLLGEKKGYIRSAVLAIKKQPLMVLSGIVCFGALLFVQFLYWHSQTGEWLIWSYGNEKFDFTSPHILSLFFGFRKGLFIYTPLALLSLVGLFSLMKKNKLMFFTSACFLLLSGFILSSWWSWWYGMSFGMRAYIDFFPFVFLLFAIGAQSIRHRYTKVLFGTLALIFVCINQVQAYQYTHYILHWENMNRSNYWSVFLKTGKRYEGALWETNAVLVDGKKEITQFNYNFENPDPMWLGGGIKNSPDGSSNSKYVGWLSKDIEFSQTLVFSPASITNDSELIVKISLRYYLPDENVTAFVVVSSESGGKPSFYKAYKIPDVFKDKVTNQWCNFSSAMKVDKVMRGTQMKVYVYNPEKKEFYIDDIEVKLFQP